MHPQFTPLGREESPLSLHDANLPPTTQNTSLAGTLTHLPALASETPHALLAPLASHTGIDSQTHLKGIILLDTVALKGSSLENFRAIHEANLMGRDELRVLEGGSLEGNGVEEDDTLQM